MECHNFGVVFKERAQISDQNPRRNPFVPDFHWMPFYFDLVTVSIKTSDGSPISPSGQQLLRKFNSSPVLQQSSKISLSSTSSKISPKHSPHSGSSSHNSPKHQSLPSPKGNHYSTSSPKHSSSAGSGKPSMSTLKSATSSPNSKSSIGSSGERIKTYSSSSSRDRQVIY